MPRARLTAEWACLVVLLVLFVGGPVLVYRNASVQEVERGSTLVLLEARDKVGSWAADDALYGGRIAIVGDGCLGVVRPDGERVAVWPAGTTIAGRGDDVRVDGLAVGTPILYGHAGLTALESRSVPSRCGDPDLEPIGEFREATVSELG